MDSKVHEKYTGVNNELILNNLKNLASHVRRESNKKIWIRTPLIPGATATKENIEKIGIFIRKELIDVIDRWELCAFNNICKEKYQKLNQKWKYEETPLMDQEEIHKLVTVAKRYAGSLVVISGLTKK